QSCASKGVCRLGGQQETACNGAALLANTAAVLLPYILAFFTVVSLVLTLWQWLVASNFPLHRRLPVPDSLPPATILKPLKRVDSHTADCLRSWFEMDYPAVQILF